MVGYARSASEPRRRSALCGALDPPRHGAEGLVELRGLLAAGLRQIRATAAATTHELGDLLDQFARLEALGEVLRDRGHQADLVVDHRAEANHAGAHPLAQGIDDGAEAFRIEPVEASG